MFRSRPRKYVRRRGGIRHDPIIRSAFLGLLVYALGLIPFYFLTPVHQTIQAFFAPPTENNVLPSDTNRSLPGEPNHLGSSPDAKTQIGADTNSVVAAASPLPPTPAPVPTLPTGDQRFAFLLLGYGGSGHDGAYLTDSMMVVIVDPPHKTLTLLSLPRDSWVPLLFDGRTAVYNKVNTAYAFAQDPTLYPDRLARYTGSQGPGNFAMDTASRLLGVPITYYLGLDFQGFRDMINTVGGIDVDVPDGFAARYPKNDDPSIDASWMIVRFQPGLQHMDGERAIEYARARETIDNPNEGTDFARSRRQRLIMEAFKTRLFEPGGLIHIPQLLAIAAKHVDTNYSVPDVAQLGQLILGWKDVKIYQTALTTSNYLEDGTGPDGTYITIPNAPGHSWAPIRAFVRRLWQDPPVGVAMASTTIVVENDTGVPGVAGRVSDSLIKLGYQVGDPISGPRRDHSQLVDQSAGKATLLIKQLQGDLGLKSLVVSSAPPTDAGGLVLELGADAADLSVSVPEDSQAPTSIVGVVKFGQWPYVPSQPTPDPVVTRRALPNPNAIAKNPAESLVPNLIGLPEATAQRLIVEDGFVNTAVNYQTINDVADHRYFRSIPPGDVLSQSPPPGRSVARGAKVSLAVRKP